MATDPKPAAVATPSVPVSTGRLIPWSTEEDELLRQLVELHGCKKWALIASKMPNKGSKQCRRRWQNYLNNADAKQGGWSGDEDALLLEGHAKFGNRWTEIAKMVTGRTDNAVKNRHAVLVKKQAKPEKPRAKKRKPEEEPVSPAHAAVAPPPKLPPVRTTVAPSGARPKAGANKRAKLSVRVPGRASAAAAAAHAGLPPGLRMSDPGLSPNELQLFHEVNALLTPSMGADWDMLGLLSARAGAGPAGAAGGGGTPLDTPVADMASVFSWFLSGSPTAGGSGAGPGPGAGGAAGGAGAAGPSAAAGGPGGITPSAASVAALIRTLSPTVSPSTTPRAGAGGAAAATPAGRGKAAAGAAGKLPDGALTAEMGQKMLLHKLLHLRASGGAQAAGGAAGGAGGSQPPTPLSPTFFDHVFSPLGTRRASPRLAPIKTAMGAPADGGRKGEAPPPPLAASPAFTPQELQLLLATLGGENPFAGGVLSDDAGGSVRRSPRMGVTGGTGGRGR